jgi:hypothetical protein
MERETEKAFLQILTDCLRSEGWNIETQYKDAIRVLLGKDRWVALRITPVSMVSGDGTGLRSLDFIPVGVGWGQQPPRLYQWDLLRDRTTEQLVSLARGSLVSMRSVANRLDRERSLAEKEASDLRALAIEKLSGLGWEMDLVEPVANSKVSIPGDLVDFVGVSIGPEIHPLRWVVRVNGQRVASLVSLPQAIKLSQDLLGVFAGSKPPSA